MFNFITRKFKKSNFKADYEYQKQRADSLELKLNFVLSGIADVVKKVDNNGNVSYENMEQ